MGRVDVEIHAYMQRARLALKVAESNFKDDYWVDAVSKSYIAMFYAALVRTKGLHIVRGGPFRTRPIKEPLDLSHPMN